MSTLSLKIEEEVKNLPPRYLKEVLDFIAFVKQDGNMNPSPIILNPSPIIRLFPFRDLGGIKGIKGLDNQIGRKYN